jgi:hypothetical protein
MEEIAMKKPKMVADLLAVADVCIEASEAWAQLLESHGKGPSREKDDREVNTTQRGIRETAENIGTAENNSQIRRRGDPSDALMT